MKHSEPEHSLFAFSASPRWIPCAGSMAYPINTADGGDAGEYADEGTAAHTLAAKCLKDKVDATEFIGDKIKGGKREFDITEEFADHVQTYIDDVRRRALGGYLMVEQRVTLDGVEGFDATNYGTSDAIIAMPARDINPAYGVVCDLKFGQGERVYAWTRATKDSLFTMSMYQGDDVIEVEPNYQLMLYALAALADIRLLVDDPTHIIIVINQPRLGMMSELRVTVEELERFALFAADAYQKGLVAMGMGVSSCEKSDAEDSTTFFNPGEKQCRWCKAVACKAREAKVREEIGAEFDVIGPITPPPPVAEFLAKAMAAVPFVAEWCNAVMKQAGELIAAGTNIIGPDEKPYKFVEGKKGKRGWIDLEKAEEALLGQLDAEKVYKQSIITAPAAAKLLNKKATKELWTDVFEPLIRQPDGKPILVQGSDPRPPFSFASGADEFDVEETHDD